MTQPDPHGDYQPSWRKPVGALLLLLLALTWTVLVASLSYWIGQMHGLAQTLIYLIAGIAWIFPAMPLLRWMETGRFRRR